MVTKNAPGGNQKETSPANPARARGQDKNVYEEIE